MSKVVVDIVRNRKDAQEIDCDYLVRGSEKSWINFNGTGTVATRDSLNVSGLIDITTGQYTVNFSSSFSAADYSMTGVISSPGAINGYGSIGTPGPQTTSCNVGSVSSAGSGFDPSHLYFSFTGDLA